MQCSWRHPSCWPGHYQLVEDYRAARQADVERLERETGLYAAEMAEWRQTHTMVTFKSWLIGSACRYRHRSPSPGRETGDGADPAYGLR